MTSRHLCSYTDEPPLVDEARDLIKHIRRGFGSPTAQSIAIIFCGLLIARAIGELAESVDRLDPTGRR